MLEGSIGMRCNAVGTTDATIMLPNSHWIMILATWERSLQIRIDDYIEVLPVEVEDGRSSKSPIIPALLKFTLNSPAFPRRSRPHFGRPIFLGDIIVDEAKI